MSEKEPFWLGIDCGGTYLKAGLYNSQGKEVCIERRSVATLSPRAGYAERDMHQLWQHCHITVALLLKNSGADGGQIKGVGISAQGKGLFLLDKQDRPLGTPFSPPIAVRWRSYNAGSRTVYPKSSIHILARRCGRGIRPHSCAGLKRTSRSGISKLAA